MKGKETFRVYPGTPFCDIGECPYREAIARCYSRGWFLGMTATRFGPDRPLERAMLAAVLHRVAGCPQPPRRGLFFDVSPPLLLRPGRGLVRLPGDSARPGPGPVLPRPGGELGGAAPGPVAVGGLPRRRGGPRGNLGPGPGLRLARGLVPAPVLGGGRPGGGQLFPAPVTGVPPAA